MKLHADTVRRAPRLGFVCDVKTDRRAREECASYKWWKITLGHYMCEHGENAYKIEDDGHTISCSCEDMTYRCRPGEVCKHIVAYSNLGSPPTEPLSGELARLLQDAVRTGRQLQSPQETKPERTRAEEIVMGMDNAELKRNANKGGILAIAELRRRADGH